MDDDGHQQLASLIGDLETLIRFLDDPGAGNGHAHRVVVAAREGLKEIKINAQQAATASSPAGLTSWRRMDSA